MNFNDSLTEFEKLYKDNFKFLCLVAFQITKDHASAKDIVQDFFIYLWNKETRLEFTVSFKSYATRAVKNLSLQYIESRKKLELNKEQLLENSVEAPILFEKSENIKIKKVKELIAKIPEARRKIFISHVVDGLSYAQIAENYGISVNTVKTQMKRSYAFLRSIENQDLTAAVLLFLFSGTI